MTNYIVKYITMTKKGNHLATYDLAIANNTYTGGYYKWQVKDHFIYSYIAS